MIGEFDKICLWLWQFLQQKIAFGKLVLKRIIFAGANRKQVKKSRLLF
jgi:hypothetical protein